MEIDVDASLPRHTDHEPLKTCRSGSATAPDPPHSEAQATASQRPSRSQKGYLETRLKPPISRNEHPQSVLIPTLKVRNQKKNQQTVKAMFLKPSRLGSRW